MEYSLFAYCINNPIGNIDVAGYAWYKNYYGYKKTGKGFNLYANIAFLSRTFCLAYANAFLKDNGKWHWFYGRRYSGMNALRIAQELWFHAIGYYLGSGLKRVLQAVKISWTWLNNKVVSAHYMEINSDDDRAWIYSLVWWAGSSIKTAICRYLSVPKRIIAAIVL